MDMSQRGIAEGDFASAISLYHAYDLLLQHGLRTFYNFVTKVTGDGDPAAGNTPNSGINRFTTLTGLIFAENIFHIICIKIRDDILRKN
jgi:hypothetical protein